MKILLLCLLAISSTLFCKSSTTKFDKIFNYILDDEKLTNEILVDFTDNYELRIIRNSIYAKHNYIFKSDDLSDYFKKYDWYSPNLDNVDHLLTANDKFNISLISKLEQKAKFTIDKAIVSPSKKYRIEFIQINEYDERCKINTPTFDDTNLNICLVRIIDNSTEKILYKAMLGDETRPKERETCFPFQSFYPLAHGFHSWKDDKILYYNNLYWYGANESHSTYYLFDWKSCTNEKILSYESEHCPDFCKFISYIKYKKNNYVFYFDKESNSIKGERLIIDMNNDQNLFNLYFKSDDEIFSLKSNITENVYKQSIKDADSIFIVIEIPNLVISSDGLKQIFSLETESVIH